MVWRQRYFVLWVVIDLSYIFVKGHSSTHIYFFTGSHRKNYVSLLNFFEGWEWLISQG